MAQAPVTETQNRRVMRRFVPLFLALWAVSLAGAEEALRVPAGLGPGEQREIRASVEALGSRLEALGDHPRRADAEVFLKGVRWACRYEEALAPADLALVRKALRRGTERARDLAAGREPWSGKRGRLVRGYVSAVDGSAQPYGLIVPAGYDPRRPIRLDVVLHGSTRPVGLSELRFMDRFDEGDSGGRAPDQPWIELHPLGRVENCYRWAGETDVFEAIEDVCRVYNIDRDRIVLRGMSMGASGTWHLGLKHPDRFVALGPYCGYVDTHQFSLSPIPNFVKVGPLPEHQELGLHMLDSVDYAANAGIVPVVAAIGEKDPFFQAHVIMGEAFRKEGLPFTNLISPGTGHVQDPATHAEQLRRIGAFAERGVDRAPKSLRFVTWTLKYPRAHWLEVLGLDRHYRRAEIRAALTPEGTVVEPPVNINRFALQPAALKGPLRIAGRTVPYPAAKKALVFERSGDRWVCRGRRSAYRPSGKAPGLQGPIDDAFTRPFLCVRGTGTPWNDRAHAWARAALDRFTNEWNRYFRGELPVKDDTDVTDEDVKRHNLILFGDPGSNRWIRKVLPKLPLRWTRTELRLGGQTYSAGDHAPVLINRNPLARDRYVVLNSGHTFHEAELSTLNYLLFPRLGDWAVMRIGSEEPVRAGYFDENWR